MNRSTKVLLLGLGLLMLPTMAAAHTHFYVGIGGPYVPPPPVYYTPPPPPAYYAPPTVYYYPPSEYYGSPYYAPGWQGDDEDWRWRAARPWGYYRHDDDDD